ncbi:hypothetical protein L1049_017313 [Liquidambar formosana]|uniref:CASP-like protein n=1 Tax=Liquidambar formosana TaxID=63359 RepID=A0AAP0X453_LIQFO
MASTDKPAAESGEPVVLTKSEVPPSGPPPRAADCFAVDVALRFLLFASTLAAVLVMVTAKQTKSVTVPGFPTPGPVPAKFNHSPALIYFVVALSVACLYSLITLVLSLSAILKPVYSTLFVFHFALLDVIILGLVASATGTAGGVAYIGLKGNSHVRWNKVCNVYDKFCQHIGSSVAISLFASVVLVLLVLLSIYSLRRRIPC